MWEKVESELRNIGDVFEIHYYMKYGQIGLIIHKNGLNEGIIKFSENKIYKRTFSSLEEAKIWVENKIAVNIDNDF